MGDKRLLVTGASGFLGWNVCLAAAKSWRVYGTANRHPNALPSGVAHLTADLTSARDRQKLLDEVRPDAVMHLAAASQPNQCQSQPLSSHLINVDAAVGLAELCRSRSLGFLFTSSDQVFDGANAPYRESSPTSPINVYGEQKVEAERRIVECCPSAVICRMPLMYGDPSPSSGSFLQSLLSALRSGKPIHLFVDEYRTVVGAPSAADGLLRAVEMEREVLHLGGRERLSRYEFGLRLAKAIGAPTSLVRACRQCDVPMAAPRPADVSLDSSKAFALGFSPRTLEEEFAGLHCMRG